MVVIENLAIVRRLEMFGLSGRFTSLLLITFFSFGLTQALTVAHAQNNCSIQQKAVSNAQKRLDIAQINFNRASEKVIQQQLRNDEAIFRWADRREVLRQRWLQIKSDGEIRKSEYKKRNPICAGIRLFCSGFSRVVESADRRTSAAFRALESWELRYQLVLNQNKSRLIAAERNKLRTAERLAANVEIFNAAVQALNQCLNPPAPVPPAGSEA